jgi:hypothetical protein
VLVVSAIRGSWITFMLRNMKPGSLSHRANAGLRQTPKLVPSLGWIAQFIAAMPVNGKSLGNPEFDPEWAASQEASRT